VDWDAVHAHYDAILLSNTLLAGLAAPLREAFHVPVWSAVQGEVWYIDQMGAPWSERVWRALSQRLPDLDGLIPVSQHALGVLQDRTEGPLPPAHVVHNGIDPSGFAPPVEPPEPTVGFFARLYDAKGLTLLAQALTQLAQRGIRPRILLCGTANEGDASDLERALDVLTQANLRRRVRVHPSVSTEQKQALLRQMTLFCVPSLKPETFGMYSLEALATGLPLVSPRQGALPEWLGSYPHVRWFEPGNVNALADQLEAGLLQADAEATIAGPAFVRQRFTHRHMAREVAAVVSEGAAPRGQRSRRSAAHSA